jgi:hypothetical protein
VEHVGTETHRYVSIVFWWYSLVVLIIALYATAEKLKSD